MKKRQIFEFEYEGKFYHAIFEEFALIELSCDDENGIARELMCPHLFEDVAYQIKKQMMCCIIWLNSRDPYS